jgi:hypothetical protein
MEREPGVPLVQRIVLLVSAVFLISIGIQDVDWQPLFLSSHSGGASRPEAAVPAAVPPASNAITLHDTLALPPRHSSKDTLPTVFHTGTLQVLVRAAWDGTNRPGLNNQLVAFSQMLRYMCHPNMSKAVRVESGIYAGLSPRFSVVMPTMVSSGPYSKNAGNPMPAFPAWASRGKPGDVSRYLHISGAQKCDLIYHDESLPLEQRQRVLKSSNSSGSGGNRDSNSSSDNTKQRTATEEDSATLSRSRCRKCQTYTDPQLLRLHLMDGNSSIYTKIARVDAGTGRTNDNHGLWSASRLGAFKGLSKTIRNEPPQQSEADDGLWQLDFCAPCVQISLQSFFHFPTDLARNTKPATYVRDFMPFSGFSDLVLEVARKIRSPRRFVGENATVTPPPPPPPLIPSWRPFYAAQWRVKGAFQGMCEGHYPRAMMCKQDPLELVRQLRALGVPLDAAPGAPLATPPPGNTSDDYSAAQRSRQLLAAPSSNASMETTSRPLATAGPPVYLLTNEDREPEMRRLQTFGLQFCNHVVREFDGGEEYDLRLMAEMALAVEAEIAVLHPSSTFKFIIAGLRYNLGKPVTFYNMSVLSTARSSAASNKKQRHVSAHPIKSPENPNVLVGHHHSNEKVTVTVRESESRHSRVKAIHHSEIEEAEGGRGSIWQVNGAHAADSNAMGAPPHLHGEVEPDFAHTWPGGR